MSEIGSLWRPISPPSYYFSKIVIEGGNILIIVKAKPPKKSGKDIVYETKELYNKTKGRKGE